VNNNASKHHFKWITQNEADVAPPMPGVWASNGESHIKEWLAFFMPHP
jgi:hypothetical protein